MKIRPRVDVVPESQRRLSFGRPPGAVDYFFRFSPVVFPRNATHACPVEACGGEERSTLKEGADGEYMRDVFSLAGPPFLLMFLTEDKDGRRERKRYIRKRERWSYRNDIFAGAHELNYGCAMECTCYSFPALR